MSTSFIEQTNQTRIDLHNRLLDDQNELQGKIQQLIKNYGKDSADRHLREGYYAGRLEQLKELCQQFCDLDEEVQQAALPTESEYSSRLIVLKDIKGSSWTTYLLEAIHQRPPDEPQPTSRSQQESK